MKPWPIPRPSGKAGIHRHQMRETFRHLAQHSQPEQPAPVLADQRDLLKVELLYEPPQPAHMRAITVGIVVTGLSERPKPIRSGTITRPVAASVGIMRR